MTSDTTKRRRTTGLIVLASVLFVGSLARARDVLRSGMPWQIRPVQPDTPRSIRQRDDAVGYCFDADAAILLTSGADGLPGRGGEDDNLNGIIDDRSEMGAVPSDDRCLSPADPGYSGAADRDETMVISRGTYVRCDSAERILTHDGWWIGE
ncbi:hypothetical protein [Roseiconus lacunae]|uniref:Uncharacterized protein n=1 Tax=Roseiconus lacunae TaxID=2605694 RepID=A0ABT7PJ79_9BACT|nr:hypothetical protein [Roseiconus lacunae]MDM4016557.1 hypothetical protein [Roseiconus lacunae]